MQWYNQIECTKKRKKNDLPVLWRRCGWWQRGGPHPLCFHSCFPSLLCPLSSLFSLFFLAFSVLMMMNWGRCWLLLPIRDLGFVLGFFYAGTSAEMKAIAGTILCVYWIPFLSFSLCIISLLRGFCFCFGSSFPFLTLYFFWVVFCVLCFSGFLLQNPPFFPGLSLAFIKPEKVRCPCLHKWWASWRREIMTASWV